MGGTYEVVELTVSSSTRRRLAVAFLLLVVSLIAFFAIDPIRTYLAWQANPDDGYASISLWTSTLRFAMLAGGSAIGGAVVWILVARELRRTGIRIETGRIKGRLFASKPTILDLEISTIFSVAVRRRCDGVILSLAVNHNEGSVILRGYSSLDAALEAVIYWHPKEIDIIETGQPTVDDRVALFGYGLVIVGFFTTLRFLEAWTFATQPLVILALGLTFAVAITLLQIAWGMRRKDLTMRAHGVARLTGYVVLAMAIAFAYMIPNHQTIDDPQGENVSNEVAPIQLPDSIE